MSRMSRALVVAAIGIVLATPGESAAAGADGEQSYAAIGAAAVPGLVGDVDWSLAPVRVGQTGQSRGALLPSLYVGLAALNAFDAYSTSAALRSGAGVEANPLMSGVANHSPALWAVKGGATAATIFLAERMWRNHNRVGAVATMIVSNSLMAAVAANNARVVRMR